MGWGAENPVGGAGAADMDGLWVRNGWLLVVTDRGWKPVKPPKPAGLLAPTPLLDVTLYPLVPGAEENVGAAEAADLKDGGAPAGGGGRRGREACVGGVEDDEEVWEALRPGGGGYDMMNGWAG